jgi:hypothetical protein
MRKMVRLLRLLFPFCFLFSSNVDIGSGVESMPPLAIQIPSSNDSEVPVITLTMSPPHQFTQTPSVRRRRVRKGVTANKSEFDP